MRDTFLGGNKENVGKKVYTSRRHTFISSGKGASTPKFSYMPKRVDGKLSRDKREAQERLRKKLNVMNSKRPPFMACGKYEGSFNKHATNNMIKKERFDEGQEVKTQRRKMNFIYARKVEKKNKSNTKPKSVEKKEVSVREKLVDSTHLSDDFHVPKSLHNSIENISVKAPEENLTTNKKRTRHHSLYPTPRFSRPNRNSIERLKQSSTPFSPYNLRPRSVQKNKIIPVTPTPVVNSKKNDISGTSKNSATDEWYYQASPMDDLFNKRKR